MKKTVQIGITVIGMAFFPMRGSTEEAPYTGKLAEIKEIIRQTAHADYSNLDKMYRENSFPFLDFATSNGISTNTVTAIAMNMLAEALAGSEKQIAKNYDEIIFLATFLGCLDVKGALPLLRKAAIRTISGGLISIEAVHAYISLAGLDALDFVEMMLNDEQNYNRGEREYTYRTFAKRVEEEHKRLRHGDEGKMRDAQAFLLRLIQTEKDGDLLRRLDNTLCAVLPEYGTSAQRGELISRFKPTSPSGIALTSLESEHFRKAKAAVDKAPENQRKDFRAKGELLDPEREKGK